MVLASREQRLSDGGRGQMRGTAPSTKLSTRADPEIPKSRRRNRGATSERHRKAPQTRIAPNTRATCRHQGPTPRRQDTVAIHACRSPGSCAPRATLESCRTTQSTHLFGALLSLSVAKAFYVVEANRTRNTMTCSVRDIRAVQLALLAPRAEIVARQILEQQHIIVEIPEQFCSQRFA